MEAYLDRRTAKTVASIQKAVLPFDVNGSDPVYCATCHKEHKGSAFDLTAMANARCQSCHSIQFSDFHDSHPSFGDYPFSRRTRIFFDHASHFGKHFSDWMKKNPDTPKAPANCGDCHTLSTDTKHMGVKAFGEVCASCHIQQIVGNERAQGPKGVPFFTLPGLDVETLKKKKADIGDWPQRAEGEITPFMKVFIARDERRRLMLKRVEELDLLDLTNASDDDIAAVTDFAWEVKFLLYGLVKLKPSDVMARVGGSTGAKISAEEMVPLTSTLPRDVLVKAQSAWLPKLASEVENSKKKRWLAWLSYSPPSEGERRIRPAKTVSTTEDAPEDKKASKLSKSDALPVRPKRLNAAKPGSEKTTPQIKPKAAEKKAEDAPTTTEKFQKNPPTPNQDLAPARSPDLQPSGPQTDDLLIEEKDIPKSNRSSNQRHERQHDEVVERLEITVIPSAGMGPIRLAQRLRINEYGEIVEEEETPSPKEKPKPQPKVTPQKPKVVEPAPAPVAKPDPVVPKKPKVTEPATAPVTKPNPVVPRGRTQQLIPAWNSQQKNKARAKDEPVPAKKPAIIRKTPKLGTEDWAEFGGWYRQDFSILYKPSGHKDQFLRAWLDLTGKVYVGSESDPATHIFDDLTSKEAQGQCRKCHSVDATNEGRRLVNWSPSTLPTRTSAFTRFGHAPHLGLFEKDLCLSCHGMSEEKGHQKTYEGFDPTVAVSNFKSVEQKTCATCHQEGKARADCLLCHKYHVDGVGSPLATSKIPQ